MSTVIALIKDLTQGQKCGSTLVECRPHHSKVKGLFPAASALLKELRLGKGDCTVVEHLPYDPKVKGLCPPATALLKELT